MKSRSSATNGSFVCRRQSNEGSNRFSARKFKEAGTGLAIPAQTTYLRRDRTPDAEQARAAEAEVEAWRKAGVLPFPWVSQERQAEVTDTLPYPPAGTPSGSPTAPQGVLNPTASKGGAPKKQR